MSQIVRIFITGGSQALRIPRACSFDGVKELKVSRVGDKLILAPVRKSWLSLNDDSEPVGGDFMKERPLGCTQKRFR